MSSPVPAGTRRGRPCPVRSASTACDGPGRESSPAATASALCLGRFQTRRRLTVSRATAANARREPEQPGALPQQIPPRVGLVERCVARSTACPKGTSDESVPAKANDPVNDPIRTTGSPTSSASSIAPPTSRASVPSKHAERTEGGRPRDEPAARSGSRSTAGLRHAAGLDDRPEHETRAGGRSRRRAPQRTRSSRPRARRADEAPYQSPEGPLLRSPWIVAAPSKMETEARPSPSAYACTWAESSHVRPGSLLGHELRGVGRRLQVRPDLVDGPLHWPTKRASSSAADATFGSASGRGSRARDGPAPAPSPWTSVFPSFPVRPASAGRRSRGFASI